jgi:hypothetical protein
VTEIAFAVTNATEINLFTSHAADQLKVSKLTCMESVCDYTRLSNGRNNVAYKMTQAGFQFEAKRSMMVINQTFRIVNYDGDETFKWRVHEDAKGVVTEPC